jgi:hypothetical protein
MRNLLLACALAGLAGCSNESTCLPAIASAGACPSDTFVDASVNDPICLSSSGLPLCRGSDNATCYVCSGLDFTDNCVIKSAQQTIECVHSCTNC